jgi:diacylglycerol kinase family enzyme
MHSWTPVEPPRTPVLFVNERSGGGAARRVGLREKARVRGVQVIVLEPGQSLEALVDEAVADGADALGMAGGDGSLGVVAAAAAAHDLPFVCLPAGTRNHFALDLGLDPHDIAGALDAFSEGLERRIDLGEVNGRTFVNNVSLGLYGEAVQQSAYRDAKVRTLAETAAKVLGPSSRPPRVRLVDDVGHEHTELAVVLVSNNPYALERPRPASRPALGTGTLGIVVLDAPGHRPPPGRAWTAPDFEIDATEPVPAGIDGEAVTLSPPLLRFSVQSAALRVRIAARHEGALRTKRRPPRAR